MDMNFQNCIFYFLRKQIKSSNNQINIHKPKINQNCFLRMVAKWKKNKNLFQYFQTLIQTQNESSKTNIYDFFDLQSKLTIFFFN